MYLGEQMTNPCTQGRGATRRLIFVVFSVYIPAESMEKRQQGTVVRTVFGGQGPQLGEGVQVHKEEAEIQASTESFH